MLKDLCEEFIKDTPAEILQRVKLIKRPTIKLCIKSYRGYGFRG
jgi:hypothetical protein